MEKLFSQIIGTPVVTEDSGRPVSRIHDLFVDPETGNLVAFEVSKHQVVAPRDVLEFKNYLLIHDHEDICPADEILRVAEIKKLHIPIFKNRVETESGEYLGRVYDFSIETKTNKLKRLFVAKSLLWILRIDERAISEKYIIEMTSEKIIVKDQLAKIPIEHSEEIETEKEFFSV